MEDEIKAGSVAMTEADACIRRMQMIVDNSSVPVERFLAYQFLDGINGLRRQLDALRHADNFEEATRDFCSALDAASGKNENNPGEPIDGH